MSTPENEVGVDPKATPPAPGSTPTPGPTPDAPENKSVLGKVASAVKGVASSAVSNVGDQLKKTLLGGDEANNANNNAQAKEKDQNPYLKMMDNFEQWMTNVNQAINRFLLDAATAGVTAGYNKLTNKSPAPEPEQGGKPELEQEEKQEALAQQTPAPTASAPPPPPPPKTDASFRLAPMPDPVTKPEQALASFNDRNLDTTTPSNTSTTPTPTPEPEPEESSSLGLGR